MFVACLQVASPNGLLRCPPVAGIDEIEIALGRNALKRTSQILRDLE